MPSSNPKQKRSANVTGLFFFFQDVIDFILELRFPRVMVFFLRVCVFLIFILVKAIQRDQSPAQVWLIIMLEIEPRTSEHQK